MKNTFKSITYLFWIITISPLLTQCASQDEIRNMHYQLRVVSNKVDTMKANTVDSIQKRQASSSNQLDLLVNDISQLKSQIEELAHINRMLQEQQKEHSVTLQSLSNAIHQQQEEEKAIKTAKIKEAERNAREARLAAEKAKAQRKRAEVSAARAFKASGGVETIRARRNNKVIKYGNTPYQQTETNPNSQQKSIIVPEPIPQGDLINQGQIAYDKGNFQQAFDLFKRYVSLNQTSPSTMTARYMMAESLYNLKQYNQAIMQYQKIISNYPGDPKVATALFRQGNSFQQLSDMETAKMIYNKLISSHPSSPEALKAKKKVDKL